MAPGLRVGAGIPYSKGGELTKLVSAVAFKVKRRKYSKM
jgi:hypothetical protein